MSRADHDAFRATIDANPHDEQPWHVYADYLDEQGMPSHAAAARKMAGHARDGRLKAAHVVGEHRRYGDNNFVSNTADPTHILGQYQEGYFDPELIADSPALRERIASYQHSQNWNHATPGAYIPGEGDLMTYPTWAAYVDEPLTNETMLRRPYIQGEPSDGPLQHPTDEDQPHYHEHIWEHSNGRATLVNAEKPSHLIDILAPHIGS